jgi:ABC-type transport system involved in multi-copper enzyme maturation permease subunit
MTPLVRKEIRLLLPAWIAALAVMTMPVWPWQDFEFVSPGFFGAAILALALAPFGQEMSYGTFGLLLVQPEERRRIWNIKTGLLAVALVSAWTLFALCLWSSRGLAGHADWAAWLTMSALMTLLAFSGGLWSTLLLRDIVASFVCAFSVPTIICAVILATVGHWVDPHYESNRFLTILCCVLAGYVAAGFWWARRLFLGAQDVVWTGGQISLTAVRGMSLRWLAFEFKGRQNRWTALVKKELQLQEATMALIPLLALLYLAALAIHHFAPMWIDQEFISGAVPSLWLAAVPLVIGCVAVAEERRFNTLDSLLCLPISKRASFTVKLAVALALGIVLGGVIPWVLLGMGGVRPNDFDLQKAVEVAAVITGVAFYASTMSRGLLQAVPTALCIAVLMGMAVTLYMRFCFAVGGDFVFTLAVFLLAWPAMTLTFVWLAFQNYKRLQIGWRVWVGNLTRAGAVFSCVTLVASAIFDRPWELFQSLEPRHGPARLNGTGRAGIGIWESNLCVLLPDGRLWIGEKDRSLKSISGGFVRGSNWVEMAAGFEGAVAIQSDGTLWRLRTASDIRQIGSDSDWKKIAGNLHFFQALKQDGTLWIASYIDNFIADPVRVGDDSDWVDVFALFEERAMFVKRDGSKWGWKTYPIGAHGHRLLNARLERIRWNMEGTNWSSMAGWYPILGIRTDGSLWASGDLPSKIFGEKVRPGWYPKAVRVGTKSDWVTINGHWHWVALKADGTLWTMEEWSASGQTKRPSQYADWLAATQCGRLTWALAKDGTLSCWNEFDWEAYSTGMGKIILGPTRRPIFSGNILDEKQ